MDPRISRHLWLIETEFRYVQALNKILTDYRDPLKGREDLQTIFQHIEYLHNQHSSFHACMYEKARFNDNKREIASCFLNFRDKFTHYASYCVTLFQNQSILDNQKDARLEECQRKADYKLRDLLFLPITRFLKYPLLLTQIIEETNNLDDYQNLKRAHEMMDDLCHHLNEIKRDIETIQIIRVVEQRVTDLLPEHGKLEDYGRLLIDGKVKLKKGDDDAHKMWVFVFDKAMLICQWSMFDVYHLKEILNLRDYDLRTKFTNDTCSTREKWSHNFNLIKVSDGTKYHFYTKTGEQRNWMNAILEARDSMRSYLNHEFVKQNFDVTSVCDVCTKILRGTFFQGYRCQCCSMALHKECIASVHRACTMSGCEMYVNFKLADYPWFHGRMGREQAQSILENTQDGTFLVRVSPKHNGSYVISLNHRSKVNHMRIFVSVDNCLYLSECKYFKSVPELVNWYKNNSLNESFQMLDARLEYPAYNS